MSDAPPPSLLITPDMRRRLQQRYEQALQAASRQPCDFARVHELLAECLRPDPGNILYLDALLANLRKWQPRPAWSWMPSWLSGAKSHSPKDAESPEAVLRAAPDLLLSKPANPAVLRSLADAAGSCDLDEVEIRYLVEARNHASDELQTLRQLARVLTRQGRFEEALGPWFAVLALEPADAEAAQAVLDLRPIKLGLENPAEPTVHGDAAQVATALEVARSLRHQGLWQAADDCLSRALAAAGSDLRVFEEREALRLAHSEQRWAVGSARAVSDPHPKAQALVARLEQEHNRLAIDIFHLRSERHPDDPALRLELARRLKKAGNYSGAIQRLEEARGDAMLAAAVLLELGECWQHLRQFSKALDFYRQAAIEAERNSADNLVSSLYRIGVLAAAMNRPAEAREALARVLAIDPDYKDARERAQV
jgi:tetratricopeptide (TPR) repeat protein